MELEKQVTILELSKKLKELGVKQESLFYWRLGYITSSEINNGIETKKGIFGDYELQYFPRPRYTTADVKDNQKDLDKLNKTEISAFSVAELGELLRKGMRGQVVLQSSERIRQLALKINSITDNEAENRAKMLIYLIENKLITL